MKGKFITFEGCEGSGKSTQLKLLKNYTDGKGIKTLFTREPGGTEISEKIRGIILDPLNAAMSPETELLLYSAARAQHVREVITPALKKGLLTVCDRFIDSTYAYQGAARGLDRRAVQAVCAVSAAGIKIDATVFLNIPPEKAFERKGGFDRADRVENEGLSFHNRVYAGYLEILKNAPDRVINIDASGDADDVFNKILSALRERGIIA